MEQMWMNGTKDRRYWVGFHESAGLFLFDKQWQDEEKVNDPKYIGYVPIFLYGSTRHAFENRDVLKAGLKTYDWYMEDRGISQDIANEQIRRLISYYEDYLDHGLANHYADHGDSEERELLWRRRAFENEQLIAQQDGYSKRRKRLDQLRMLLEQGGLTEDDASFLWRNRDCLSQKEVGRLGESFREPQIEYAVDMSPQRCTTPRTNWDVCEACERPVDFCRCSN
jgi:hypothetical protein